MRSALSALLVALLVTTAGCASLEQSSQPPSDDRATAALDRARTALQNVSTYRYRIDGEVSATDGDRTIRADVQGDGAVDATARQVLGRTTVRGETRRHWVVGDRIYTECSEMGWGRSNRSTDEPWMAVTPVAGQLAVLSETPVYWRGYTEYDGQTASVIVAHPSAETLQQSMADGAGSSPGVVDGAKVTNATQTVWLDPDTGLPIAVRRTVAIESRGATGQATVTIEASDYDEPVDVEAPNVSDGIVWERGCPSG